MFGLLRRWGSQSLRREVRKLRSQLADATAERDILQRKLDVVEAERDTLAAVCARDRERVVAETAGYARATE